MQIGASTAAQVNTHYVVNAAGAGTIDITLPGLANVGDFVSVRGASDNPWRLIPGWAPTTTARSQVMPFVITTTNLLGNAPAGQQWTPHLEPKQWHWVASDPLGSVLVAADIPGQLHVSLDAGATWDAGNSPTANWVSVAMSRTPSASDPLGAYSLQLVAVAYGGGIYRYSGGAWTQVTDPAVNLSGREWESVNLDPGGGILAAVLNGPIYYSTSTGFVAATAVGSTAPLIRGWRASGGTLRRRQPGWGSLGVIRRWPDVDTAQCHHRRLAGLQLVVSRSGVGRRQHDRRGRPLQLRPLPLA